MVQLQNAEYFVNESAAGVQICAELSMGILERSASVMFRTQDDSAVSTGIFEHYFSFLPIFIMFILFVFR